MNNRRNYYRILHVQPEAPVEIIKASYRSLMTKLKAHPDLGGDHASAVLINQAYAVLSDPQKRRKYDEMMYSSNPQFFRRPVFSSDFQQSGSSTSGRNFTHRDNKDKPRSASYQTERKCLFCNAALTITAFKSCSNCESPLTPLQTAQNNRRCELIGRRTVPRIAKAGTLTIYPSWPHSGYPGRLRDLSTLGLSMVMECALKTGQIIKFDADFLKGVARVVTVRAFGSAFSVHAVFMTAEFVTKSGVFVSEKA